MTRAGFPHSEIRGSKLAWQLPAAYRSLQRPSSASSAKASTGCPSKLAETMLALAMQFPRFADGLCSAPAGGRPVIGRVVPTVRLRPPRGARCPRRPEVVGGVAGTLEGARPQPSKLHRVPIPAVSPLYRWTTRGGPWRWGDVRMNSQWFTEAVVAHAD